MSKTYTIFGAGPGGLYSAWRLITKGGLTKGDTVRLVEWGKYKFEDGDCGTRLPAGRICSHHYQGNPDNSYIEVGGMRYLEWNNNKKTGHQLVTEVINKLNLNKQVVDFRTTENPLMYLRGKNFYQKDLGNGTTEAPYNTPGNNIKPADELSGNISKLMTEGSDIETRAQQCGFYSSGKLSENISSYVYKSGDTISNIGYWNFFYDQAGNEGYNYAADAGGYSSNVINWNAANAAVYNGEFAPGGEYKTLKAGYSQLFKALYTSAKSDAGKKGIHFEIKSGKRLHSIWMQEKRPHYYLATDQNPFKSDGDPQSTDYAILAMPPHAVELVARATRYVSMGEGKTDFLNNQKVQNYLESVIEQPSLKIAMFFDTEWWKKATYPPKLVNSAGNDDVFGPTITDLSLRQIYYFGNNAPGKSNGKPVYGILASYDDMRFTQFWREMDIGVDKRRCTPISQNYQALQGAQRATSTMERMVILELAKVHYNDPNATCNIPKPLETVVMDWGLAPFGAGYHGWAAHYDIADVMQKIRTPAKLGGAEADQEETVFLIGSAFSNDQAWVEGAFCTAESVLTEFLNLETIADTTKYPLICGCKH